MHFKSPIMLGVNTSEMTLNYRVIVERYPSMNGMVGGSIPTVKCSLYLMRINYLGM